MRISYRDATPGDAPTLALVNRHLIEDERHVNPMSLPELEARMRDWLTRGEYRAALFFASDDVGPDEERDTEGERERGAAAGIEPDAPAGYVLYQIRRDYYFPEREVVYVRHFYVERGRRRQGIGRLAFEMLARERFPAGATIDLEVLATNPVGRAFWTSLGFEPRYTAMRRET